MILNSYVVKKAAMLVGKPYIYGAKIPKGTQPQQVKAVDCSGLVQWTCGELGVATNMIGNAAQQYSRCIPLTVAVAKNTPGALVFRYDSAKGRIGHVGISDGKGNTIEARGKAYGVVKTKWRKSWTHAALIPGVHYI